MASASTQEAEADRRQAAERQCIGCYEWFPPAELAPWADGIERCQDCREGLQCEYDQRVRLPRVRL